MFHPIKYEASLLDLTKYENIIDGEIELSFVSDPDRVEATPKLIFIIDGNHPDLDGYKFDLDMHGEIYGIVRLCKREDSSGFENRYDAQMVFPSSRLR